MSGRRFWIAAALVILAIAGGVSYLASSSPDGLDSATLRGCQVVQVDGAEELTGECIARSAADHPVTASPLADYAVLGADGTVGPAGMIGALLTLALAGGIFRLIAATRSRPQARTGSGD